MNLVRCRRRRPLSDLALARARAYRAFWALPAGSARKEERERESARGHNTRPPLGH